MLQIKNIHKEYKTGTLVQKALDDVSLNLRDNEFVAILGPSGSGKTTLLNIVGGLDRYDSGDLIINGVSTKRYKDRDWDSYRNHTIGFVFQSYNLIPHQTLLANVELALTISGVGRKERKQRALEALDKVGLAEQAHKKPNQLSGGQMQRVAIARALVNNPDILLADEPTGALDTVTSVQVMDLLKEVAQDRLVVMVTHNPELAEEYANRIVRLKDGKIISDSNPFDPDTSAVKPVHKNLGKAVMSFFTALGLSFNNLLTKKARTILVSFAGSIGIIGIALILALSNGANKYIKDTEEQTLSEYPLQITSTSFSLTSMLSTREQMTAEHEGTVLEVSAVNNIFAMFGSNDLASLRDYFENNSDVHDYARAVEYSYNLTPQIFTLNEEEHTARGVNPNHDFDALGLGTDGYIASMMSSSMYSMDVFHVLPSEPSLYEGQYEVLAGRWPESSSEAVLVLNQNGAVSDYIIYTFNLRDPEELTQMVNEFVEGGTFEGDSEPRQWEYDDFLGFDFHVIGAYQYYDYDEALGFYADRTEDRDYIYDVVSNDSRDLTVVGIVQPAPDADIYMLSDGVYYRADLITELMEDAADSQIVQDQLADMDINVLTGERFDAEENGIDMSSLFTINEDAIADAFIFDEESFQLDASSFSDIDLSGIDLVGAFQGAIPELTEDDIRSVVDSIDLQVDQEALASLMTEVAQGYAEYAASDPTTDYSTYPDALNQYFNSEEGQQMLASQAMILAAQRNPDGSVPPEAMQAYTDNVMAGYAEYAAANNLPDAASVRGSYDEYMNSESTRETIRNGLAEAINMDELQEQLAQGMAPYTDRLNASLNAAMNSVMASVGEAISEQIGEVMRDSMSNIGDAISVDQDAFAAAFEMNFDETQMQAMFTQLMNTEMSSAANNLSAFGYVDVDNLSSITIYPNDFEAKEHITGIIDEYNAQADENEKISYTDIVGTLMSSVTKIVDAISYVLVAFVSISLIVSSIMIGVITYISVLERRKEIGILRAMGASKRNISQVFNAETLITGFLAGFLGVTVSLLLLIPGNMIIRHVTGIAILKAYLTPVESVSLVLLSIILTIIGGLIPSQKAAKSDPVTALRTE